MPKVIAWQCEQTEKLFATQDEYRKHLRKLARERMKERVRLQAERDYKERMAIGMAAQSFRDIATWVEANVPLLYTGTSPYQRARKGAECPTITEVRFENMRWVDGVPAMHSAPRGRKEVWRSEDHPGVPTHHPGWRGRFCYTTTDYYNWDSSAWKRAGICTGGGGGGHKSSYDVIIWAEDFPVMVANAILRGEITFNQAPFLSVKRALALIGR